MKKIFVVLIAMGIVGLGVLSFIGSQTNSFAKQQMMIEEPQIVSIETGATLNSVLYDFSSKGWIELTPYSRLLRFIKPSFASIKTGSFEITPNSDLNEILNNISKGKEHQFALTFIEGSTFKEWRVQLSEAAALEQDIADLSESQIADKLNIEYAKLEGLLLAETYHYTAGMSDLDILERAHSRLMEELDLAWSRRQTSLPLASAYEALILASIIEKETGVASERELVSSVFINRLNIEMRLQTDPTVIYGMGERYDGNIRKKDLQEHTEYNTYRINGLPPTPIAMVGRASLIASMNPEASNYYYFVATGTGGHIFSTTLPEHNRAVQAYLKQLRKNRTND